MIAPPDYHIHTRFSCDSKTAVMAACEAAITRGMREIAVTDHADFEPLDEGCGYLRADAYLAEIERCRRKYDGTLTIRTGVEIGEGHVHRDRAAALLEAHEFDFVLGSLHWVNGHPTWDGRYFGRHTLTEGLRAYFDELTHLAAEADYDVLAHFGIVRRAAYKAFKLQTLDYAPYEGAIRRILRILIERGNGLEINTATCRRGMGAPSPTLQVLRWYRQMGGEILTLGSDAHISDAIGAHFDTALDLAREAGFTRLGTYEKREPRWVELPRHRNGVIQESIGSAIRMALSESRAVAPSEWRHPKIEL